MFKLKFLMRCCCENPEEAKQAGSHDSKPLNIEERPKMKLDFQSKEKSPAIESSMIATLSQINDKSYASLPKLLLEIIESSVIEVGTILTIGPNGLDHSKRNKNDNKTLIGSELTEEGEIINDFVIKEELHGMGKRHICIEFSYSTQKYMISDLGDGTGTFIKIGNELILKEGFIISFGNSHMKVISIGANNSPDKKIVLKFLEGPKIHEDYCFQPSDDRILIGRMADCRIRFDDSNLSRYQCNLSYTPSKGWVLKDGIADKKSTNGTWMYVEEEFEMYEGLIFKAGKTLFEVKFG